MQAVLQRGERSSPSSDPEPPSACVRCRAKKLKCHPSQEPCTNCDRNGVICMTVDPNSGRQYERKHLKMLRDRVAYLRQKLREQDLQSMGAQQPVVDAAQRLETFSARGDADARPWKARRDFSDGSIFSLGISISAAVSVSFPTGLTGQHDGPPPQLLDPSILEPAQRQDLPPLSTACELINYYFDMGFQKVSPFMRRSQAFKQVERLYDSRVTGTSRTASRNDMFQLFMIFAVATSTVKPMDRDRSASIAYYATAMEYWDVLTQSASCDQIQNFLLLLVFASLHGVGSRSISVARPAALKVDLATVGSKWRLARQAMRACIQLGYHRASDQRLDVVTEQLQSRLFWCCYVQERFAACNLARPIVISDSEITANMPDDVHLDIVGSDQKPSLLPNVPSEVSILIRQAQLRKITTAVREELYTQKYPGPEAKSRKEISASRLDAELTHWRIIHTGKGTVPGSLCVFDTPEYMEINYHRERLFIFSALALPEDLGCPSFQPDIKHLRCCLDSAIQVIRHFQLLSDRGVAMPLWTQVQDVLRSGFIILYCGIHLPLFLSTTDQVDSVPDIPAIEATSEPAVISRCVDDCRQMLQDICHKWPAVDRHRVAFERLSHKVQRWMQDSFLLGNDNITEPGGHFQLQLESTLPHVPMEFTAWDGLLDADFDIEAVFGQDFDTPMQGF